jgi:hypothetical protein
LEIRFIKIVNVVSTVHQATRTVTVWWAGRNTLKNLAVEIIRGYAKEKMVNAAVLNKLTQIFLARKSTMPQDFTN